jgi:hypothetical protein
MSSSSSCLQSSSVGLSFSPAAVTILMCMCRCRCSAPVGAPSRGPLMPADTPFNLPVVGSRQNAPKLPASPTAGARKLRNLSPRRCCSHMPRCELILRRPRESCRHCYGKHPPPPSVIGELAAAHAHVCCLLLYVVLLSSCSDLVNVQAQPIAL